MSVVYKKPTPGIGLFVIVVMILAAALAGCGKSVRAATPPTTAPATTPATTRPTAAPTTPRRTAPPTTVWTLKAPQASPDDAAAALVGAWAAGDRATALTVATPTAVEALFAVPYPGAGLAISRGCSAAFPPIVCTYGPPGGGSPNDPVFQVYPSQSKTGWYVSSVMPET
jgi:hypothetical protein